MHFLYRSATIINAWIAFFASIGILNFVRKLITALWNEFTISTVMLINPCDEAASEEKLNFLAQYLSDNISKIEKNLIFFNEIISKLIDLPV